MCMPVVQEGVKKWTTVQCLGEVVLCPYKKGSNRMNTQTEMALPPIPRMKTLREMVELTGLSYCFLRNLCMRNEIVHIRTGTKYLINYDRFIDYLNGKPCS